MFLILDAFPKVETNYTTRSTRGGALTLVLVIAIWLLIWTELKDYAKGVQKMEFVVDKSISTTMQVNIDLTMAMPCNGRVAMHLCAPSNLSPQRGRN